jgi:hypothetical protein
VASNMPVRFVSLALAITPNVPRNWDGDATRYVPLKQCTLYPSLDSPAASGALPAAEASLNEERMAPTTKQQREALSTCLDALTNKRPERPEATGGVMEGSWHAAAGLAKQDPRPYELARSQKNGGGHGHRSRA